ncbi:N-acylneuraminate cytidylyltransferase [Candidatus Magnetaquicoccaceae bacterium FCR-1]|uniref:N-acylneuraminate cytidylyltransferase n=1 Tax=Candidatus Magnetaquiglobus chichijimensis TaxID=3141448 RepID=A0ABQ0C5R2_9PROT
MIGAETVLAVIPARGGSKGVMRKNIRPLAGKPLLAWSIEAARLCPEIDRLILSSEDDEIIATARAHGCEVPFPRPPELAGDDARAIDVALHLLDTLPESYDWLLWLQPTSPLRCAEDIRNALRLAVERRADSVVGVTPADKSPYWMFHVQADGAMEPVLSGDATRRNRQELPPVCQLNGALNLVRTAWIRQSHRFIDARTLAYVMPPERSLDIDSERDFLVAEWWLRASGV